MKLDLSRFFSKQRKLKEAKLTALINNEHLRPAHDEEITIRIYTAEGIVHRHLLPCYYTGNAIKTHERLTLKFHDDTTVLKITASPSQFPGVEADCKIGEEPILVEAGGSLTVQFEPEGIMTIT